MMIVRGVVTLIQTCQYYWVDNAMLLIVIMILAMGPMTMAGMNSNEDITLIMIIVASMIVMMIATTQFQVYKNAPATIVVVMKIVSAITTIQMIRIRRLHISWFPIVSICTL